MVDRNVLIPMPIDDFEKETDKGYYFLLNDRIEHVGKKVSSYDPETGVLSVARWVIEHNLDSWGLKFIKIYEVAKRR